MRKKKKKKKKNAFLKLIYFKLQNPQLDKRTFIIDVLIFFFFFLLPPAGQVHLPKAKLKMEEPLFRVIMRTPKATDWKKILIPYLKDKYTAAEVEDHKDEIEKLQSAWKRLSDGVKLDHIRSEFAGEVVIPYSALVLCIANRFPGLKGTFHWSDQQGKEKGSCPYYEAASGFYCAPSTLMKTASECDMNNSDSIKTAYQLYLSAAGMFQWGKQHLIPRAMEVTTTSVVVSIKWFEFCEIFCIAEAMRCACLKASVEGAMSSKHSLMSKLANDTATQYNTALGSLSAAEVPEHFRKEVKLYIEVAYNSYLARSHDYLAEECRAAEDIGTEISNLHAAIQYIQRASIAAGTATDKRQAAFVGGLTNAYKQRLQRAREENARIYGARIPSEEPERQSLGKSFVPTEFATAHMEIEDPFSHFVPTAIVDAVNKFSDDVAQIINHTTQQARSRSRRASYADISETIAVFEAQKTQALPQQLERKIISIQEESSSSSKQFLLSLLSPVSKQVDQCNNFVTHATEKLQADYKEEQTVREQYGSSLPISSLHSQDMESARNAVTDVATRLDEISMNIKQFRQIAEQNSDQLERLDYPVSQVNDALKSCEQSELDQQMSAKLSEIKRLDDQLEEYEAVQLVALNEMRQKPDLQQLTDVLVGLTTELARSQSIEDYMVPYLSFQQEVVKSSNAIQALTRTLHTEIESFQLSVEGGLTLNPTAERVVSRLVQAHSLYCNYHNDIIDMSRNAGDVCIFFFFFFLNDIFFSSEK